MVAHAEAVGLPRLGDDVADIEDRRSCLVESRKHLRRQQMGQNAGIEAAGRENNQVGLSHRPDDLLADVDAVVVVEALDVADVFADGHLAEIFFLAVFPDQLDLLLRERQDRPLHVQKLRHIVRCLRKAPLHVDEGGQHHVAHRVIVEAPVAGKAIAQQGREILIHVGHGDQDLPDVSHSRNIQFFLQNPRAAAVVADGDHRRDLHREKLQPREQDRKPGSSPEHHQFFHLDPFPFKKTGRSLLIGPNFLAFLRLTWRDEPSDQR